MKLRRKPHKQPPQYYCNECKTHYIALKDEIVIGKIENLVMFHNKTYTLNTEPDKTFHPHQRGESL